jgi:hypothetical protein
LFVHSAHHIVLQNSRNDLKNASLFPSAGEKVIKYFFIVVPCILIILKFLSPTNAHFIKPIKC